MEGNLRALVHNNYKPMKESSHDFSLTPPSSDDSLASLAPKDNSTKTIKFSIDSDSGKMTIDGERYLRIGKIQLYNSLDDSLFFNQKYLAILDTHLQILHCFEIDKLYNDFIAAEKVSPVTKHGTFHLSDSARNMVLGEMFNK